MVWGFYKLCHLQLHHPGNKVKISFKKSGALYTVADSALSSPITILICKAIPTMSFWSSKFKLIFILEEYLCFKKLTVSWVSGVVVRILFHIFILDVFNDIFNSQIIKCQSTGRVVHKWMRRNVKESSHGLIRYYCNICLEELRKTTWNVSQDSWPLNQDSNPGLPK